MKKFVLGLSLTLSVLSAVLFCKGTVNAQTVNKTGTLKTYNTDTLSATYAPYYTGENTTVNGHRINTLISTGTATFTFDLPDGMDASKFTCQNAYIQNYPSRVSLGNYYIPAGGVEYGFALSVNISDVSNAPDRLTIRYDLNGNAGTATCERLNFFNTFYVYQYYTKAVVNMPLTLTEDEVSAVEAYYEEINDTCDDIEKAAKGLNHDGSANAGNIIVYDAGGALNSQIMKAVASNPGANVFVDYTYMGIKFRSALVPAVATQVSAENIPWYGPCYLASHFPTMIIGTV